MIEKDPRPTPTSQHSADRLIVLLFALASLLILCLNSFQMITEVRAIAKVKRVVPYSFPGHKFLGLEKFFHDAAYVGYISDKNMAEFEGGAQFAQAQLILAPTILDFDNLSHEYTIFDCSSAEIGLQKAKEAGLIPMKKNQFGIILARRK